MMAWVVGYLLVAAATAVVASALMTQNKEFMRVVEGAWEVPTLGLILGCVWPVVLCVAAVHVLSGRLVRRLKEQG